MLLTWQHRLLVALGVVALALVVGNGWLFVQNRARQIELNQRQQYIQQTVPLQGLYNEIVQTLAQMAVKGNDREVLNMLASQGLNVSVTVPATAPAAAPAKGEK